MEVGGRAARAARAALERDADPVERQAIARMQRRLRALLLATLAAYLVLASWVFFGGWYELMQSTPIQPEALALYLGLLVLAAVPLALRLLYSRLLVASLTRMAQALRAARDEARQGSQAKADFLATMSHEIRTPMNAVIGFAELLGKTPLQPAQAEYAAAIRESGTHLLSVINDVLDYSKIEAGRIELDEKAFEVVPLVESCMKALSLAAAQKGLQMGFSRSGDTPQALFSDALRLRQVLLNLLSNAVKFTDRGEVQVTLSSTPEPDGRHLVRFAVRDTGVGIPAAARGRLFHAFTQADSSLTRRQDGTGLGLAISRRLCQLMGGTLDVESEEGRGSTFVAAIRASPAPLPPRLRSRPPAAFKGLRLLVVDDHAMNRIFVARNAQSWGMRVRATGDPRQAISWLRAGDPCDAAIVDHHLPAMDGILLAQALRAARPALPILLATLVHDLSDGGRDPPYDGRIRKPFLATDLLEGLRAALEAHAPQPQPRRGKTAPLEDPAAAPPGGNGLRILLVEDNTMNRRLALKVLQSLGHGADVAENGADALKAALRKPYDVVLMDVQMPVMDGLQATRAMCRQLPRHARPFTIGLSANALAGERERCLGAGMDEYLPKPMDQDRLAGLLAMVERRRKARPRTPPGRAQPGRLQSGRARSRRAPAGPVGGAAPAGT